MSRQPEEHVNEDLWVLEGRDLSSEQASELERKLRRDPLNRELRARLLGFHGKSARVSAQARKRVRAMHLWFIEHAPESSVNEIPIFDLPVKSNRAFYRRARELWLAQCRIRPVNVVVLEHAAQFFSRCDAKVAARLYRRGERIEPRKPEWKEHLGRMYEVKALEGDPARRRSAARAALHKYEEARRLTRDRHLRFYKLPTLAKAAFSAGDLSKATKYAGAAITDAATFKDWAHGNGIHHGHVVLGRVALAQGDAKLAVHHLLEAGRSPGSPQLNSFGPNFSLADDLLQAGDRESVLEFLDLCRRFWSYGAKALDAWRTQIHAGQRPNFKATWKYLP